MRIHLDSMLRATVLTSLAIIACLAHAETRCIRQGGEEIILFDDVQKRCPGQIVAVDPKLGWKFADSTGQPGCWRSDDRFVYVLLKSSALSIHLIGAIEPLSACEKYTAQEFDRTWAYVSEVCENFDVDDEDAVGFCRRALAMAERFGEGDPRLWRAIDVLAARTDDLVESERLIERSKVIHQKYATADHEALMANLIGIARIRQKQGQFDAAEASFLEAIRLGRQHLGDDSLDVVAWTLLLGKMYFDLGKYPQAEEQLLLALASAERDRPIYWRMAHRLAASTARILADLYQKQRKGIEAERFREISRKHRAAAKQPQIPEFNSPPGNFEES